MCWMFSLDCMISYSLEVGLALYVGRQDQMVRNIRGSGSDITRFVPMVAVHRRSGKEKHKFYGC
jgi:hypothetical protein